MPGAYKRESDKLRGPSGKWVGWYYDRHGVRVTFTGTTDKRSTLEIAKEREKEERLIREGLIDQAGVRYREQAARPIADHVEEFHEAMIGRGNTPKHARTTRQQVTRLIEEASLSRIDDLSADRIGKALGRMRSWAAASTINAHVTSIKNFVGWLDEVDRIESVPKGIRTLAKLDAKNDRRYVRREPRPDDWPKILEAASGGATYFRRDQKGRNRTIVASLNGPDRVVLYRVAAATGFRVNELRSLTRESFVLDDDNPCVILSGAIAKNRKEVRQPIPREVAREIGPWVEGLEPGEPAWFIPHRSAAMLHEDLAIAGIDPRDEQGRVIDFHSLRSFYINDLRRRGVDPKSLQTLARHSSPVLTFNTYMSADDDEGLRRAVEKGRGAEDD